MINIAVCDDESTFLKLFQDILEGYLNTLDIKYVEIYGHWIKIHTKTGVFNCYGSLTDYEKKWKKYGFVRTHKSYLVNAWYIYSILKDTVTLESGEEIMLSRSKVQEVMKKFEVIMRSI